MFRKFKIELKVSLKMFWGFGLFMSPSLCLKGIETK